MSSPTPPPNADPSGSSQRAVLVLNAGSSSLKFALVAPASGERAITGLAERLGTDEASLRLTVNGETDERAMPGAAHREVAAEIIDAARSLGDDWQPVGVGHRVVHGGERFADSVLIDDDVVKAIEEFSSLAPLHNPPALLGIAAVTACWPEVAQAAVFDTAFHQTMPPRAYRYAVPRDWYDDLGIRRYGFHGTSHRYVSMRAAELLDRPLDETAFVVCHLGNGCSAAAVLGGESVDTTMGLTPLEGLVMGTRSGDIDAGVFGYLADERGWTSAEVTEHLNKRSGLLGVSGRSNDMRALQTAAADGDADAALAIDIFAYRLSKAVAALSVALGRLDAVVFTGGIGENDADIRARVVGALGIVGLTLDAAANDEHGRSTGGRISAGQAPAALVVATDEELMIALDTSRLTAGG